MCWAEVRWPSSENTCKDRGRVGLGGPSSPLFIRSRRPYSGHRRILFPVLPHSFAAGLKFLSIYAMAMPAALLHKTLFSQTGKGRKPMDKKGKELNIRMYPRLRWHIQCLHQHPSRSRGSYTNFPPELGRATFKAPSDENYLDSMVTGFFEVCSI